MVGEFFGLCAFAGTATAFLGPFSVATLTSIFHSQRAGLSIVILFLVVGGLLPYRVKEAQTVV
jgi:UMF1 family MFS transporter